MEVRTSAGVKVPHAEFFPPPPPPRGPSVWLATIADDRRELVKFWPVVQKLVVQELRVRYQRSFLGFVWTLLNPLLMLATLGFVFSLSCSRDRSRITRCSCSPAMVPWDLPEHQLLRTTAAMSASSSQRGA